jgi:hypothetical protein
LSTHHTAEAVSDVNDTNAIDRKLERFEKRGELNQPNRP